MEALMQAIIPDASVPYSADLRRDLYDKLLETQKMMVDTGGKTPQLDGWKSVSDDERKAICEGLLCLQLASQQE